MLKAVASRTLPSERRDAPRYNRVVRVNCHASDGTKNTLTRDIGPSGAYLLTPGVPNPGETLTLTLESDNEPTVVMHARVVRKVYRTPEEAPIPGSGVHWLRASTRGTPADLRRVLGSTIGLKPIVCSSDDDSGAYYEFN